jgi:hypothetical protein
VEKLHPTDFASIKSLPSPPTMSIATANQTINWCPPIHRDLTPSTDPSDVSLPPGFAVLILGASQGIGLATAECYAKAGASLIIVTGRNEKTLEAAKIRIEAAAKDRSKFRVVTVLCDVFREEDIVGLASHLASGGNDWGSIKKIDALIINAGKANGLVKQVDGTMDWPHSVT